MVIKGIYYCSIRFQSNKSIKYHSFFMFFLELSCRFTRLIPLEVTSTDKEVLELSHHPHTDSMLFYGSFLKWLYQIAFPSHQVSQMNIGK